MANKVDKQIDKYHDNLNKPTMFTMCLAYVKTNVCLKRKPGYAAVTAFLLSWAA